MPFSYEQAFITKYCFFTVGMVRFLIIILAFALSVVVGLAGYVTLKACTLDAPFVRSLLSLNCRSDAEKAAMDRLVTLRAEHLALLQEIRQKENELGKLQCVADWPTPDPILVPAPTPEPTPEPVDQTQIDEAAWRAGDIAVLDGCWELETNLPVTNFATGEVAQFNQWRMCFGGAGQGTQEMSATNGDSCTSAVSGEFNGSGSIRITQPVDFNCTVGPNIPKFVSTCSLIGNGNAECNIYQPDTRGRDTVRFRRALRN